MAFIVIVELSFSFSFKQRRDETFDFFGFRTLYIFSAIAHIYMSGSAIDVIMDLGWLDVRMGYFWRGVLQVWAYCEEAVKPKGKASGHIWAG